jgi:hypothetical protein
VVAGRAGSGQRRVAAAKRQQLGESRPVAVGSDDAGQLSVQVLAASQASEGRTISAQTAASSAGTSPLAALTG